MSKRERYTRELLVSTAAGAALSMILCLILPGIETKSDIFGMYWPIWILATIGIWQLFDTAERINKHVGNKHRGQMGTRHRLRVLKSRKAA